MRATWFLILPFATLAAGVPLTPSVAGEDPQATARQLAASQNNLKQMGLAFHSYQDVNGFLPQDIKDKDGTPILSWRVAILPYIEQNALFNEFKLDEPWDSANNKKLIAKLPKTYAPVSGKPKEGETFYQVFTGAKSLFGGKGKVTIQGISDGSSNTGMIFEAGEPVIWTKPADLPFDEKKALPKLGGLFDGDFNVCLGDGSVRRIKKDADEAELKKLIMPADGMPIDFDKLKK